MIRTFLTRARWLGLQIAELIYPPFCVLCDATLDHGDDHGLCEICITEYPILSDHLCVKCSKPLADFSHDRCHDCRKRTHFYEEGKGLWVYEDGVKEAIRRYKYKNRQELGPVFAKIMAEYYNGCMDWPVDCVIPVPLHPKKKRQRGFDQTGLMAKSFSKEVGLPVMKGALKRTRPTLPQEGLSDKERYDNVQDAFICNDPAVRGRNILLLDDVYTTGATIDGCARALLDQGAEAVYFMTIAVGRGY